MFRTGCWKNKHIFCLSFHLTNFCLNNVSENVSYIEASPTGRPCSGCRPKCCAMRTWCQVLIKFKNRNNKQLSSLFSLFRYASLLQLILQAFTVSKEPVKSIIDACYTDQQKINVGNVRTWLAAKWGKWIAKTTPISSGKTVRINTTTEEVEWCSTQTLCLISNSHKREWPNGFLLSNDSILLDGAQ